jgi:hypothetical protein
MNWKTSAAAVLVAATALQATITAGASLTDWKTWILPVAIAFFGFLAKDANDNTTPPAN